MQTITQLTDALVDNIINDLNGIKLMCRDCRWNSATQLSIEIREKVNGIYAAINVDCWRNDLRMLGMLNENK
jgi:hypothetical protein